MRYIALLRGINVGGKNKVAMSELKKCFENLGFQNVKTYINSGNVIFDAQQTSNLSLIEQCQSIIEQHFGFHVICVVINADELNDCLKHAPKWWDQEPSAKHNAIFIVDPATSSQIMQEIRKTMPSYEKITIYRSIIFWSAPLDSFDISRYNKIVRTKTHQAITIRNANTTKMLAKLCQLDKDL